MDFDQISVSATKNMTNREKVESSVSNILQSSVILEKRAIYNITEDCRICRLDASNPKRLGLTVGSDGMKFNCRVHLVKIVFCGRTVIHMVDKESPSWPRNSLRSRHRRKYSMKYRDFGTFCTRPRISSW